MTSHSPEDRDQLDRGTILALGAMALAVFLIANDFTALSVALPNIEREFDSDVSSVQWVINGYALVFGVFIVTGGRLADMFGRRRLFFVGAGIFAAFSAVAAIAPSLGVLLAARALMGIGGAIMWPAVLGMTFALLPGAQGRPGGWAHPRRGRARQRVRAAPRRLPHRGAELALGVRDQPAGRRRRGVRHVAPDPSAVRARPDRAGRLRSASQRSRSRWSRC